MDAVITFIERGGDLVYPIGLVIFLIWLNVLLRLFYLYWTFPRLANTAIAEWQRRSDKASWSAQQIHRELSARFRMGLHRDLPTIKMLIVICPLLGLLGTVTGMIEVFDVMMRLGAGSPKAMASGISKAILSTVAGMVAAITGLMAQSLLLRIASAKERQLQQALAW
ncbi:biopolymer transporter ExbB [Bacterioplanes sanyensis]|uniref:Biopolymer transporter ExbB n=1 Tax=Bacterioplanes sanyensis TaxID=1249553 RepID=A0A222FL88_9GAMM|nr:MotA/TolQ/ExbB proton channel family protein [Bacterioplanes sanyensis]ASP38983.1 biopolymer transporter ExbB [Bacterioplanes sanyensis]